MEQMVALVEAAVPARVAAEAVVQEEGADIAEAVVAQGQDLQVVAVAVVAVPEIPHTSATTTATLVRIVQAAM